jgi:predicted SprT family Zn-dependent metalloprotease
MDQVKRNEFTKKVKECLQQAATLFNMPSINDTEIHYFEKGRCAGTASQRGGVYSVRFNEFNIENDWDEMVNETIPHEIAHIVCFERPHLGSNHDMGWKRVCRMLGGDGSRTHNMKVALTKHVERKRYQYRDMNGFVHTIGPKHHKLIQTRKSVMFAVRGQGNVMLCAHNLVNTVGFVRNDEGATIKSPDSTIPFKPHGASKMEYCTILVKANPSLTRGTMIELMIKHAGMTKAGAGTYYQQIKSKLEHEKQIAATFS